MQLANRLNRTSAYFGKLVKLNYLAPDIVAEILDGKQPPQLTRKSLIDTNLPLEWALQRRMLGFPAA